MWENQNSFNYKEISSTQNTFIGIVSNGKIFNTYNQQVGVTNDEYKKAMDTINECRELLYKNGILPRPKTPEELNQELQDTLKKTQDMMAEMSVSLTNLNAKVTQLEHESKEVQELITQPVSQPVSQPVTEKSHVKQANANERSQQVYQSSKSANS